MHGNDSLEGLRGSVPMGFILLGPRLDMRDKEFRDPLDGRIIGHREQGQIVAQRVLRRQSEFDPHERVHSEFGNRPFDREAVG